MSRLGQRMWVPERWVMGGYTRARRVPIDCPWQETRRAREERRRPGARSSRLRQAGDWGLLVSLVAPRLSGLSSLCDLGARHLKRKVSSASAAPVSLEPHTPVLLTACLRPSPGCVLQPSWTRCMVTPRRFCCVFGVQGGPGSRRWKPVTAVFTRRLPFLRPRRSSAAFVRFSGCLLLAALATMTISRTSLPCFGPLEPRIKHPTPQRGHEGTGETSSMCDLCTPSDARIQTQAPERARIPSTIEIPIRPWGAIGTPLKSLYLVAPQEP